MSATFTTFCSDALIDASIRSRPDSPDKTIMRLAITTDLGDYITIHFKDETNFKAFCSKHNFDIGDSQNEKQIG